MERYAEVNIIFTRKSCAFQKYNRSFFMKHYKGKDLLAGKRGGAVCVPTAD
jgi:hypothetical protein